MTIRLLAFEMLDCATLGLLDCGTVELWKSRTVELCVNRTMGLLDCRSVGLWTVLFSQFCSPKDCGTVELWHFDFKTDDLSQDSTRATTSLAQGCPGGWEFVGGKPSSTTSSSQSRGRYHRLGSSEGRRWW